MSNEIEPFLNMLASNQKIAYDVETNGLRWQSCRVVGYSVSDGKEAYYVPTRHGGGYNVDNPEAFEAEVANLIEKREKPLIGHNIKFDSHMSLNHGIELGPNIRDSMIAAALLNENQFSFSLENVAKLYPDIPQKQGKELYRYMSNLLGEPEKGIMGHYWRLAGNDPVGVEYAKHDTLATWHVDDRQFKDLYAQNLDFVYFMECELTHVLRKMERRGLRIDEGRLAALRIKINQMELEAYEKLPVKDDLTPINVRSNKDLQEYFTMLDFTDWEFTKPTNRHPHGQPSFNKLFLQSNDAGHILLQARTLTDFKNKFLDGIDGFLFNSTIYTNFSQTQGDYGYGTKSGRLSCYAPNLQQVPKRDENLGSLYRELFVARDGYTFAEFDYSQAEPRLFSHYSGEPSLIDGYNATPAIDMHSVAAELMHISRKVAKNLNLGLQYTMGIAKLAKQLGISEDEARTMYYSWKGNFPNVSKFTKLASQVAEQRGYVKTILNRRARFPDPRWAYRAANRIVQGGSADILKYKIVQLDRWICENGHEENIRMLLNIHDAIVFEIEDNILDEAITNIKRIMEDVQTHPFNLKVPFIADYKTGKDWRIATYE